MNGQRRTCYDDGAILPSDDDVSASLVMQTRDVRALSTNDAREARAIRKSEETDVGRLLGLFDRLRDRGLGIVDALLVASLQSPRRVALLSVRVVVDDLPLCLGDTLLDIVDACDWRCGARRTRRRRSSGGLCRRLGFHAVGAKSAEDPALSRHSIVVLEWDRNGVGDRFLWSGVGGLRLLLV